MLAGLAALVLVTGAPARAFGVAAAIGTVAAAVAAHLLRVVSPPRLARRPPPRLATIRVAALLALAVAAVGLPRLHSSFALFGYGARYLPAVASEDLRAMARYFPPPTALAVRVRGEPGFVQSAAALESLDAAVRAVRSDPAVVRAMSLADLIKMVHRAFNENRPEFEVIPHAPGMVGRYLALAYSPGFARFVDRAFSRTAIWVYLSTDRPADLARVRAALERQLAAQPVPGGEVDPVGGDGAIVLSTARVGARLAWGLVAMLAVASLAIGLFGGALAGMRSAAGAASALLFAGGVCGWFGVPIDLASLPILIAAAIGGAAFGMGGGLGLTVAAASMGALALALHLFTGSTLAALAAALPLALARRGGRRPQFSSGGRSAAVRKRTSGR